jgi:hypothetical protein
MRASGADQSGTGQRDLTICYGGTYSTRPDLKLKSPGAV